MHERADHGINDHANDQVGHQVQRCGKGGCALDFLEEERGEELDAVHHAVGHGDHDAGRGEGGAFPEFVGD